MIRTLLHCGATTVGSTVIGGAAGYWAMAAIGADAAVGGVVGAFLTGTASAALTAVLCGQRLGRAMSRPIELIEGHLAVSGAPSAPLDLKGGASSWHAALGSHLDLLAERLRTMGDQQRRRLLDLETAHRGEVLQNRAKSQFLATMSHELRTPLNAVQGYAMLLQEDAAAANNAVAVKDLGRIQDASLQLVSLVNTILEVSRIESGATNIDRFIVDIPAMIEAVAGEFRRGPSCGAGGIAVTVEDDVDVMFGDLDRTSQCVLKLLEAAGRLSMDGQIALHVRLRKQAGMLRGVNFEVTSSGALSPSEHETLFDERAGGDERANRRLSSVAHGLSIAKRLAQSLGGELTAKAKDEAQSELTLSLPLVASSVRVVPLETSQAAEAVEKPQAEPSKGRALIIDDNSSAIDLMRRWFARLDFDVIAATDGAEGLRVAREQRPDLIFLDVYMPERSGYEVLEELRSDPVISSTPVVLMTVDGDRSKALESGAVDYIRKPAAEEQIRSVLEVYCSPAAGQILVIEDNDDAAALVGRCAEQVGFSVIRASDGVEGLRMAKAEQPDAIVLDLGLPGQDGFEVMEAMRTDARLRNIPVIVMSARDITAEHYRLIVDAGYRFFPKASLSPRELAAQLKEIAA